MAQRPRSRRMRRRWLRDSWIWRQMKRRPRPIWLLTVAHVLVLGIALLLYALPHHVIPQEGVAVGIKSERGSVSVQETPVPGAQALSADAVAVIGATEAPQETVPPNPEPQVASTPEPVGSFRTKFADHFTDGTVEHVDSTYRSANVDITISKVYDEVCETTYYVADIYIADISCLTTAFARDKVGSGYREWPQNFAERYGSIVTITGDYSGGRKDGVIIHNGTLYRDEKNVRDVCVLYWDGTVKTFTAAQFDAETEMAQGAYQCWNFGPTLLGESGQALSSFNSEVTAKNPRSAFGYFEPGHYCFVTVDGRSNKSKGMTLAELSSVMASLGCEHAYNLDGGKTAMMCGLTTVINKPYEDGRKTSDVIMILDQVAQ